MTALTETPAERIAGDLALAIHQRLIRPGDRLPSQSKLMTSYGVAMGTASAALGKLAAAGLIRTVPGSGTFAVRPNPFESNPVLDVLAASSLCRTLAVHTFGPGSAPVLEIGGGEDVDTSGDREGPLTRLVDVSALEGLDRHVLRWMSEALLSAARRLVADGSCEGDTHVIATARAILRDGGSRPENCATSREFAVPLGSSAWVLTRHLVALGLCVCVGIMMVFQESRRSIMIYSDPSLPSAGLTCGNGR